MPDIRDEFSFGPRKTGTGLIAEGDWFGDTIEVMTANGVDHRDALATLTDLFDHWTGWKADLRAALEDFHGAPGTWWVESILALAGGRFEVEVSAPSLFGDDTAIAKGSLRGGFTDVSLES